MSNQSSDNGFTHRKNVYFSKQAIEVESKLARLLDENGYAGMINSKGNPNRSAIVNACYLILTGNKDLVARKDE